MNIKASMIANKKRLFSLRFSISTIFIFLLTIMVIFISIFNTLRVIRVFSFISNSLMTAATQTITEQLHFLLSPVPPASHLAQQLFLDNVVDLNHFSEIMTYTQEQLQVLPQAGRIYWGDNRGNFIVTRRLANHLMATEYREQTPQYTRHQLIIQDANGRILKTRAIPGIGFDPRYRPWYLVAQHAKQTAWTNTYLFYFDNPNIKQLGISSSTPIYANNQLQGVFSIGVPLKSLSDFLASHKVTPHTTAIILDEEGHIIAYPHLSTVMQTLPTTKAITLNTLNNSVLSTAFHYLKKNGKNEFSFKEKHQRYLAHFIPVLELAGHRWYIGIVAPDDDFLHSLRKYNNRVRLLLATIILSGFIAANLFSKRISQPINQLAGELEQIKFFRFDPHKPVKTRIKEVFVMSNAIESMRLGLEAFQKYVPESLVRQLIDQNEAVKIGGTTRKIALFFSDIINFTTISEQISPEQTIQHLCEYFNEVTSIISAYQGTVDKYMGDSVMAFWGAPLPDYDSVQHACHAALKCREKIANLNQRWQEQGRPPLPTRIGLHFGDVIIGNLGSFERINYTAIGDAVNIASRLEQLNKFYGTDIIVSEQVKEAVQDHFVFRILDRIIIKGRIESFCVYELIQTNHVHADEKLIEFCTHYQQGFTAYQYQAWDKAVQAFNQALQIRPTDIASKIMIVRCQAFKKHPPAKSWDGVWVYKTHYKFIES